VQISFEQGTEHSNSPSYTNTEYLSSDSKVVIKKLVELSVGAAFGEIALENANSKRTATIVAETDCKLITITRADYHNVLAEVFAKKKGDDIRFLKEVPILSTLNLRTLETLQSVMTYETYQVDQGDAIACLGTLFN
jgi:CRP-like cAMP-binding protein